MKPGRRAEELQSATKSFFIVTSNGNSGLGAKSSIFKAEFLFFLGFLIVGVCECVWLEQTANVVKVLCIICEHQTGSCPAM